MAAFGAAHLLPSDISSAPGACTTAMRKRIAWGVATSSYQIEGAWDADGKGLSIWDTFTDPAKGEIAGNATGRVAIDHYHRYQADVKLMRKLGIKTYRLSVSWPRVVPSGAAGSGVNAKGIGFYKNLVKALKAAGITPVVTLYHWDLPQALQDKYGGFMSPKLAADFAYYADAVFGALEPLGVKWFLTFNEPMSICNLGYNNGVVDFFFVCWCGESGGAVKHTPNPTPNATRRPVCAGRQEGPRGALRVRPQPAARARGGRQGLARQVREAQRRRPQPRDQRALGPAGVGLGRRQKGGRRVCRRPVCVDRRPRAQGRLPAGLFLLCCVVLLVS